MLEDFDYPQIARLIENDNADIIWVAWVRQKQERFMYYLKPHLKKGVIIAVGAAFKFFSGVDVKSSYIFSESSFRICFIVFFVSLKSN